MERPNLGLRRKASPTLLTTAAPSCNSIQAASEPTRNPLQIIAVCSSKCKKSHHAFVPGSDDRTVRLWRKDVRHLACRPQSVDACVGPAGGPLVWLWPMASNIKEEHGIAVNQSNPRRLMTCAFELSRRTRTLCATQLHASYVSICNTLVSLAFKSMKRVKFIVSYDII